MLQNSISTRSEECRAVVVHLWPCVGGREGVKRDSTDSTRLASSKAPFASTCINGPSGGGGGGRTFLQANPVQKSNSSARGLQQPAARFEIPTLLLLEKFLLYFSLMYLSFFYTFSTSSSSLNTSYCELIRFWCYSGFLRWITLYVKTCFSLFAACSSISH